MIASSDLRFPEKAYLRIVLEKDKSKKVYYVEVLGEPLLVYKEGNHE